MPTPLTALGTGVTVDYTAPANPVLRIPFSAISATTSWGTAPTSGTENLEPWVASILQALADYTSAQTTEVSKIVFSQPFAGVQSRNNVDNVQNYTYTCTMFTTQVAAAKPDGDNF